MIKGYLLLPNSVTNGSTYERYMEIRRQELGYSPLHPELHIPIGPGQTQLKIAAPLVETIVEAERFLIRLQAEIPDFEWRIEQRDFPNAQDIDWRREN